MANCGPASLSPDPEPFPLVKGNMALELCSQRRCWAILDAADSVYPIAIQEEERGWLVMAFRHRDLSDFSKEPLEFVAHSMRL